MYILVYYITLFNAIQWKQSDTLVIHQYGTYTIYSFLVLRISQTPAMAQNKCDASLLDSGYDL